MSPDRAADPFDVLGTGIAFGSLAWPTGNLTNALVGTDPWAPFKATDALWPHLSPTLTVGAWLVSGCSPSACRRPPRPSTASGPSSPSTPLDSLTEALSYVSADVLRDRISHAVSKAVESA